MKFYADLHIHSHHSLATSRQLTIPHLDVWGRKKGISVIGTGDASHPGWLSEIKSQLSSCGNGLYQIRKSSIISGAAQLSAEPTLFMLTAEISCIYKKNGKVRKVHALVLAPDFASFEKLQKKLSAIGNITSDGRPILGLDVHDLLEMVLSLKSGASLIPAHIWTPWFSVLGSKSGFDSIEECFGDLTSEIFALETGLSSDPPMNRMCSILDRFTLVSNSDAHSPEKIGREANIFTTERSYDAIIGALRHPERGFAGTVEFFPEEGKYHCDGHRACSVCWEPGETKAHGGICPVCKKPVTVGVLSRVDALADRTPETIPAAMAPFYSQTGLKSIIAQRYGMREQSKKVTEAYEATLKRFGNEFSILMDVSESELMLHDELIAAGVIRMRSGDVTRKGGYDGEFGSIAVYPEKR